MKRDITSTRVPISGAVEEAFVDVQQSFERLCLTAGMEALGAMMEADVEAACGPRHGRDDKRAAHRWGRTRGRIGFHGGKVEVERPRVRDVGGREVPIPSWDRATAEDWLGRWAMNLMPINVSTRRFGLPDGDVPAGFGSGVSKSAASRRFVALSSEKLDAFMNADLSKLELLVVQHTRGSGRNPHRRPVEAANGLAPVAGLHQHRREHDGHDPARHAQRQAMAKRQDGPAMGRRRHDRGGQGLPQAQGSQAATDPASRPRRSSGAPRRKARCPRFEGRVTFNSA